MKYRCSWDGHAAACHPRADGLWTGRAGAELSDHLPIHLHAAIEDESAPPRGAKQSRPGQEFSASARTRAHLVATLTSSLHYRCNRLTHVVPDEILTQHRSDCLTKRSHVSRLQCTQLLKKETLFERGEGRLYRGRLQQIGRLPLAYPNFTQTGKRTKLTGNCHDDGIRSGCVIGPVTYYYSGALLERRLVGERKPVPAPRLRIHKAS